MLYVRKLFPPNCSWFGFFFFVNIKGRRLIVLFILYSFKIEEKNINK